MILHNITWDTIYFHNFTIILGHHKVYGCWLFTREGILGCIFGSGTGYPSVIRYIVYGYLGKMILLKLDGAAPLITNRAPANSTNLHSLPIMCNCQESASIVAHTPDKHSINYGQPHFWL